MPIFHLQWKDPDYVDVKTGTYPQEEAAPEIFAKLRELGCAEYLVVEFDTDNMTTRVVPRKRP